MVSLYKQLATSERRVAEAERKAMARTEEVVTTERELVAAERELVAAQRELVMAERELGCVRVQALKLEQLAKDRGVELLYLRGILNMRGVLETIEAESGVPLEKTKRMDKWVWLFEGNAQLLKCVEAAARVKGARRAAEAVVKLYEHLSSHVHGSHRVDDYAKSRRKVVIYHVSPMHSRTMECICQAYSYPYEVYTPANDQEGKEEEEETENV